MEVSGQPQVPAALLPGIDPAVPISWEAGWAPERVWTLCSRENISPLPGFELPVFQFRRDEIKFISSLLIQNGLLGAWLHIPNRRERGVSAGLGNTTDTLITTSFTTTPPIPSSGVFTAIAALTVL